jgi:hypothetical protein
MAMAKTNIIAREHLARTKEPEAKQEITNIFGQIYGYQNKYTV